jgi:hypothetical protein
LWVLGAEPGSCHSPGAWNFTLAPKFLENTVHLWCRLLEEGCKLEDFRESTEVTGCVDYKCISGPQVARHVILCVSQSTYPQEHMLHVMQILCSPVPVSLQMYLQTRGLHVL